MLAKALHLIFMTTWFAGLFYLPRLFVYHAMIEPSDNDRVSIERFKVMERKLFYGIMTPSALLTIGFGLWMLYDYAWQAYAESAWLHAKFALIAALIGYHIVCWRLLLAFKRDRNRHGHVWYRWFNEIPVVFLVAIVLLATLKPF